MAYAPTTWQNGDVVTAEKMNKLEQGVKNSGGGVYIVERNGGGLNLTYNQAREILRSGQILGYYEEYHNELGNIYNELCLAYGAFYDYPSSLYRIEFYGPQYGAGIYISVDPDTDFSEGEW